MNRQEYLLTALSEEAAKIIQVANQYKSFGGRGMQSDRKTTNKERLAKACVALSAVQDMLLTEEIIPMLDFDTIASEKRNKSQAIEADLLSHSFLRS